MSEFFFYRIEAKKTGFFKRLFRKRFQICSCSCGKTHIVWLDPWGWPKQVHKTVNLDDVIKL